MNIFYLNEKPEVAAKMMVGKHIVKMILESAQLLSTAHRFLDGEHGYRISKTGRKLQNWEMPNKEKDRVLYKATHVNHPSAIWVRESEKNYNWLYKHFKALAKEYQTRYKKLHKSWRVLGKILSKPPKNILSVPMTPPPQVMPKEYQIKNNTIEAYINYYIGEKLKLGTEEEERRFFNIYKGRNK